MNLREIVIDNLKKVKAFDILDYDMKGFSPFYDEMFLATVDSIRQGRAFVSNIKEDLEKAGFKPRGIEGEESDWILIDLNDVIVSVFTPEERSRLSLEKIYLERPYQEINF